MKRFWFITGLDFNLIATSKYFVVYRSPTVVLRSLVPALLIIFFVLVKSDIYRLFAHFLLQSHIVAWCKRININYTTMAENFVVNQGREFGAA